MLAGLGMKRKRNQRDLLALQILCREIGRGVRDDLKHDLRFFLHVIFHIRLTHFMRNVNLYKFLRMLAFLIKYAILNEKGVCK